MGDTCPRCGASLYVTQEHSWLNNGDIVFRRATERRMVFMETENLDPLIKGIEEITGEPIAQIVMLACRKIICTYIRHLLPGDVSEMVRTRQLDPRTVLDQLAEAARRAGLGDFRFVSMRYERDMDDYYTASIAQPYSTLLCASIHAGAVEAVMGYDHKVAYIEVAPDLIHATAYPSRYPQELEERMTLLSHMHQDGDIELERCAECGGPIALRDFDWDIKRGVIRNRANGRRFALQGYNQLTPAFLELERRFGEGVPRAVVEAQRRYVRNGPYSFDDIQNEDHLRLQLALRGLGNLKELSLGAKGMRLRVANAALPALIVGTLQGIFEKTHGTDTEADWECSDDGDLVLEVTPRSRPRS